MLHSSTRSSSRDSGDSDTFPRGSKSPSTPDARRSGPLPHDDPNPFPRVAETVPEYSLATFFLFDNGHDYIDESTNPSCSGWFAWRGIVAAVNRRVVGSTGVVRLRDAWICDFVEVCLGGPR